MRKHTVTVGLKENWQQFLLLLVIVNGFVDGIVGLGGCDSYSITINVRSNLGMGNSGKCVSWYQSGLSLEQYGSHENRSYR